MGRVVVRELPEKHWVEPAITSSGTIVIGRGAEADLQPLGLRDWRRPQTVSSRLLEVRVGRDGVSVTSGRRGGSAAPVLWRRADRFDQWYLMGTVDRTFHLSTGTYQVVVSDLSGSRLYLEIAVADAAPTNPTDDLSVPVLGGIRSLADKRSCVIVMFGLLARIGSRPVSDSEVWSLMHKLHVEGVLLFPTPPSERVVSQTKLQKVKEALEHTRPGMTPDAFLTNLPYIEIDDEIRNDPGLGGLIRRLRELAPESDRHLLALPFGFEGD